MAKDAIYNGEREVKTFADLAHGTDVLIKKSEENEKGSYYTVMSSILLTAFTFEAYLNHIGAERFEYWEQIESIKVLDKYTVLCKELIVNPDYSRRPYQTLKSLFKFRNAIAHGKSKIIKDTKAVSSSDDPYKHAPKTEWEEFCELKNAKRAKEDIDEIITELHRAAGLGDYPLIQGMTISSISIKQKIAQQNV